MKTFFSIIIFIHLHFKMDSKLEGLDHFNPFEGSENAKRTLDNVKIPDL